MVKRLLLFLLLITGYASVGQNFHIGAKVNIGVHSTMEANSKTYYLNALSSNGLSTTVQLTGEVKSVSVPAPEIYLRYDSKNKWFAQASFLSQIYDFSFKQNESNFFNYWGAGSSVAEVRVGMGYYVYALQGGYLLKTTTLIKPFVTFGATANVLYIYRSASGWNNLPGYTSIVQDLDRINPVTIFGKAGMGLRFYDFTIEYTYQKNFSRIDSSPEPYYKSFSAGYVSVGYSFFLFNTVKKKNR